MRTYWWFFPISRRDRDTEDRPQAEIRFRELATVLVGAAFCEFLFTRLLPEYLQPDLMLVFVAYIGWRTHPLKGAFAGTLFGLTQDSLIGTLLGLNGLAKTIVGFIAYPIGRRMSVEAGLGRPFVIAALSCLSSLSVYSLSRFLSHPIGEDFMVFAVWRALVTGLVGEGVFRGYDRLKFPPKDFRRL